VCGAVGTLCVGLFALDGGLFYGGGAALLGVQAIGVIAVAAWVTIAMLVTFSVIKAVVGLRVGKDEEIEGLDLHEHGIANSYADFMPLLPGHSGEAPAPVAAASIPAASAETAIPVTDTREAPEAGAKDKGPKMTKISIITRQSMFESLEAAMSAIGITGMTMTNILGYGTQKGHPEFYRGVEVQSRLLPKIRVEIIVCKVPVRTVIETAKKALYTGNIGDGKIFVYDVENVIRVRTGEEGYDALQDE
jgi:Amt family ammonium transporter